MSYPLRNFAMYLIGIGFMALAWAKNRLSGYTTPNTVASTDIEGKIEYLYDTVASWRKYLPADVDILDRDVLELCPGSSLGTGAILVGYGARSYHAVDVFKLAGTESGDFFSRLLDRFPDAVNHKTNIARAKTLATSLSPGFFGYRVGRDFDIPKLTEGKKFDLILSCAAFEHYDDIEKTIGKISRVAQSGCVSAHIVDFQTHSRWIRERDPNNIYRYGKRLYSLFAFPGQPNRKRPVDYVNAFEANGWKNVRVIDARSIAPKLIGPSTRGLAAPFDDPAMQMTMLAGVVIAEWP